MLSGLLFLLSTSVSAEEVVDPRYTYAIELSGSVGSASIFGDKGIAQLLFGGAATFLAPVAENRKVAVGVRALRGTGGSGSSTSTGWFQTVVVGYRILSDFEKLQTRIDAQLAADISRVFPSDEPTKFGVGPRLAVGALYSVGRGWRAGLEVSAMVVAPRPRVQFELNPVVSFSW